MHCQYRGSYNAHSQVKTCGKGIWNCQPPTWQLSEVASTSIIFQCHEGTTEKLKQTVFHLLLVCKQSPTSVLFPVPGKLPSPMLANRVGPYEQSLLLGILLSKPSVFHCGKRRGTLHLTSPQLKIQGKGYLAFAARHSPEQDMSLKV